MTLKMTFTQVSHNQQQSFSELHKPGHDQPTTNIDSPAWVTTNSSPSQNCTNPHDQPTTNIDSPGSQPTAVLLRTAPTRTINQPQTLTQLGHNQQQSFSELHQPGHDQPTTNIDSPGSQPTAVLLRTAPARPWSTNHKHWLTWVTTNSSPSQNCTSPAMINQPQTLTHLGHNQQQSFSELHQPGHDQPTTNIDSPGSQPTIVLLRTAPTRPWSTNHKHWLTWVTTNSSPSQNCTNPAMINQPQTLTHLGHNQQQSFSELHQPGHDQPQVQTLHCIKNILFFYL